MLPHLSVIISVSIMLINVTTLICYHFRDYNLVNIFFKFGDFLNIFLFLQKIPQISQFSKKLEYMC